MCVHTYKFGCVAYGISAEHIHGRNINYLAERLFIHIRKLNGRNKRLAAVLIVIEPCSAIKAVRLLRRILSAAHRAKNHLVTVIVCILTDIRGLLFRMGRSLRLPLEALAVMLFVYAVPCGLIAFSVVRRSALRTDDYIVAVAKLLTAYGTMLSSVIHLKSPL